MRASRNCTTCVASKSTSSCSIHVMMGPVPSVTHLLRLCRGQIRMARGMGGRDSTSGPCCRVHRPRSQQALDPNLEYTRRHSSHRSHHPVAIDFCKRAKAGTVEKLYFSKSCGQHTVMCSTNDEHDGSLCPGTSIIVRRPNTSGIVSPIDPSTPGIAALDNPISLRPPFACEIIQQLMQ